MIPHQVINDKASVSDNVEVPTIDPPSVTKPLALQLEDRTIHTFKIPSIKKGKIDMKYFQRGGCQIIFYDSKSGKSICRTWTESAYTADFDCVPGKTCYLFGTCNCIQGAIGGLVNFSLDIKEDEVVFNFDSSDTKTNVSYVLNDSTYVDNWANYDGITLKEHLNGINIDHVVIWSQNREDSNEPTYLVELNVYDSNGVVLETIKPEPVFNPYLSYNIIDAFKLPGFGYSNTHVINNSSAEIVNMDFVQKSQAWFNFVKEESETVVNYFTGSSYISDEILDTSFINCSKFSVFFRSNSEGKDLGEVLTAQEIVGLNSSNTLLANATIELVESKLTVTLENGKYLLYNKNKTNVINLGEKAKGFTIGNKSTASVDDYKYHDLDSGLDKPFGWINKETLKNQYFLSAGVD